MPGVSCRLSVVSFQLKKNMKEAGFPIFSEDLLSLDYAQTDDEEQIWSIWGGNARVMNIQKILCYCTIQTELSF